MRRYSSSKTVDDHKIASIASTLRSTNLAYAEWDSGHYGST